MLKSKSLSVRQAGVKIIKELYKIKLERGHEIDEIFIDEMLNSMHDSVQKAGIEVRAELYTLMLNKKRWDIRFRY